MNSAIEIAASTVAGLILLAGVLFFTAFPGVRFLRVHAYLRGLKKELEPIARAVGARTKTEWVTDKGQVMYFFEFPEEKWTINNPRGADLTVNAWLTLEVGEDGYNVYVPSFSPPKTYSNDYQALIRAVDRLRSQEGPGATA